MKNYIQNDPWKVIEKGFNHEHNRITESLCSLGNGQMGHRGMFEESYSGDSLQGSYIAGVYYPDKTRVGWWKNGYPEYFAKVLNATNWIGISVQVDGQEVDLHTAEVIAFERTLNMKEGTLHRQVQLKLSGDKDIQIESLRFCSMAQSEVGAIRYSITPLNFSGKVAFTPYLDGDVHNEDTNWEEQFWTEVDQKAEPAAGYLVVETKKTHFQVASGMRFRAYVDDTQADIQAQPQEKAKYVGSSFTLDAQKGQKLTLDKICTNLSSRNHDKDALLADCRSLTSKAYNEGFDHLLKAHKQAWAHIWENGDIEIEGDVAAQQGIRFNIFHLNQTYTGEDERLNIGPKGFTGEKYGGSTYWDTEAYCLPFYLATAEQKVARQLLAYRYHHLPKAIENAELLGFTDGAALYPMVTMNGEECHNEWEITFEEIHRNGAIAYAIYDYLQHTEDIAYLAEMGLEVLIGIARFWAQRVNFSEPKNQYVMLGVTGPNEYDNNVNNNWHTNYLAAWCLKYAGECAQYVKDQYAQDYDRIIRKIQFDESKELARWNDIADNMYYPKDEKRGIFLQQEGFLDKEIKPVYQLKPRERPINQNWSWDRILRSCYIKQADVLQGLYFFENRFTKKEIERHFDFYEPLTVHESSLSPCVHTILAAALGREDKAYEM